MPEKPQTFDVEGLLSHGTWLRELALRLAKDESIADDAVQETWIAVMRHPPEERESVRPWLAKVLRNAVRMRARGEERRAAREQASQARDAGEVPSPEVLVSRAEIQRLLAGLVLELDEPYRSTVLLHFGEGLSLAEIARSQGVAPSTARWRLKVALERLRDALDAESGGRERWALAIAWIPNGALVKKNTAITIALIILLLAAVGGWLWHTKQTVELADEVESLPEKAQRLRVVGANGDHLALPGWLAQPGVASRRIAGRVLFEDKPVAGAVVELASVASDSGLFAPPRAIADADGRFDFGERPALAWVVRAGAPGKTGAAVEVDLRDPEQTPPPDDLVLELGPCESALFGTVYDASGGIIGGARLARQLTGTRVASGTGAVSTTGVDGTFELCVKPSWPHWMSIEVAADGYGAIVFSGAIVGRVRVDFELVPEATIAGRVVADETDEPVAGAHVQVQQGPWAVETTASRSAFADADGRFRITGLAPGRHQISARADKMAAGRTKHVAVRAGQTEEVELRLLAGSRVSGLVVSGGEPVSGARVFATAADGTSSKRSAVSQSDGSFVLDEVPRGIVRFRAPPYQVIAPERTTIDRPEHAGLVLEVENPGTIAGRVVRGQRPVKGARIDLRGPNASELASVFTDDRGQFELRGLHPGPWLLFASSRREGAFGRTPEVIKLERGAVEKVTIELEYAASIAGIVVDQSDAPVPDVLVEFTHTNADDLGLAMTASDGTFRATTMSGGGRYRTRVRPHLGASITLPPAAGAELPTIDLPDGSSEVTGVVLKIQLDRLSISGIVVDSAGLPVPDAKVIAKAGPRPQFLRWQRTGATTNINGRFVIANLAAGEYALQARSTSGVVETTTGVRAGTSDVRLVLPTPGTISGTVSGFKSRPEVTAIRDGHFDDAPLQASDSNGEFMIRGVSPGRYVVSARTPTEAATIVATVAPGSNTRVVLSSDGSTVLRGQVVEFRTKKPVEGIACRVLARSGDYLTGPISSAVRTDASGRFVIDPAPAGEVAVRCAGLWVLYSGGLRALSLSSSTPADVVIPIVAWSDDVAHPIADLGAETDRARLTPTLTMVRPGGPAAKAGFRAGDRLVAVDGVDVTALSPNGVWILIANRPAGTVVKLTANRGGRRVTGDVVLGEL